MAKAQMTSRERWIALLNKQQTDRVPTDYWTTGEFHQRIKKDLNCASDEDLWQKLHIDRPRIYWPKHNGSKHPLHPNGDMWGVTYQTIDYGTGAYSEAATHPLAHMTSVRELEEYPWPLADDFDYAGMSDALASDPGDRVVQAGIYEPFLLYSMMRGLELSYEDMLINPEFCECALRKIFEHAYEFNRRIWQAGRGKVDICYIAEDLGSQSAPIFSLDLYRRFILPNQKKMADLARNYGVHIMYHTDGAARVFMPDLVNIVGIEVLNPIQWRCPGMERESLVSEYGQRIAFHGAMDNQQTLPFGTVEDVVREVHENLAIYKNSRWICAPCHNIQPVTPTANIVAMYQTIHQFGVM